MKDQFILLVKKKRNATNFRIETAYCFIIRQRQENKS